MLTKLATVLPEVYYKYFFELFAKLESDAGTIRTLKVFNEEFEQTLVVEYIKAHLGESMMFSKSEQIFNCIRPIVKLCKWLND
jgi:hypothetical protein